MGRDEADGLDEAQVDHFRTFGFLLLRSAVDAAPLAAELVAALGTVRGSLSTPVTRVQYVPMMTSRTPTSLALLARFAPLAARLVAGPVLPVRAKGMRYHGSTRWHTDSSWPAVRSVGFAAYLEPLTASTGALRVLPGSHRPELAADVAAYLGRRAAPESEPPEPDVPGLALVTSPGDVIVFDERLYHASAGGQQRLQWRVDFVRDAPSAAEEAALRGYFRELFPPGARLDHDPARHPSYDAAWLASGRPWVERLGQLGVYALAAEHERPTGAEG